MTSIFQDFNGGLRTVYKEASLAQIIAATSTAPYIISTCPAQADKFLMANTTDQDIIVLVKHPPFSGMQPPIPDPQFGYQLFVKVPAGTAFNLDNTMPTKLSVPAGTTVAIYPVATPTKGFVNLFTFA